MVVSAIFDVFSRNLHNPELRGSEFEISFLDYKHQSGDTGLCVFVCGDYYRGASS